ncbi:MAG: hypothetical protein KDK66_06450, partial [Deltaproteobacteria bacterium]|nr:hypothetical protein [Deltaproteobacteria bacterium]
ALAESCFGDKNLGVMIKDLEASSPLSVAELLFGEGSARVLISLKPQQLKNVQEKLKAFHLDYHRLGQVSTASFKIAPWIDLSIDSLKKKWKEAFENIVT